MHEARVQDQHEKASSQGGGHEVSSNWHRHDPGEDNDHTMGVDDEDADLRRLADCIQHHWRLVQQLEEAAGVEKHVNKSGGKNHKLVWDKIGNRSGLEQGIADRNVEKIGEEEQLGHGGFDTMTFCETDAEIFP